MPWAQEDEGHVLIGKEEKHVHKIFKYPFMLELLPMWGKGSKGNITGRK